ncbi:CDGSH iron-sulfur domain-containing protein [Nocardioides sp.]|uniref:CDGSH iron-sulfur domain-containing protein n=1 Tax=Nocardioides sp. TaxID=35761 RepID=UPI003D14C9E2
MSCEVYSHGDVVLCPNGPMLLRGDHVVTDEDGAEHLTTRPVSAVCRCGHSATRPWCDGTHKLVTPHRAPRRPLPRNTEAGA